MKAFIKIVLIIASLVCIFVGFDKISHTYEIAEQRYDEYCDEYDSSLSIEYDNTIQIPYMAEKYYVSTSIKEVIAINSCIFAFGLILLLILIVDFIKWVNTWEKDEE